MKSKHCVLLFLLLFAPPASALERPWISDVFFYWYTWDDDRELGSWLGGIHNTPLAGYYDSRTLRDNRRSLWQASEWGMTHHFMDYWSPDWKGEDGRMREAVVMEAAESLREAGYDIWMSYYQDGENFAMREFSRNVSEKRDVHQWLRDFARSPVWPKIDGRPLQLVYARNGRPETTLDHDGFRRFLETRYQDVASLNRAWGSDFARFDEIAMTFTTTGHQRAESIEHQYRLWEAEWRKLDGLVEKEFGFPGMRASFDVGYGPFAGFGFADFARVLGGPHSYAGIFGPPHDDDAQRFIQAAVARKHGTVFFDHLKNFYFDWDIRVPGMAYLPDPFHFDRFWVGALARKSEALLHLSWNEWWEGSNLEPCREFGKTNCEKNLFYATLMKLAFESIRTSGEGAPVALLLNDWRFASGGGHDEELYGTVQILRRLGVPFDLVPDQFVTAERLDRFDLVVAPAYGCGLGYNARREPIADVLAEWLKGGKRRWIVSHHATLAEKLGVAEVEPPPTAPAAPGGDLNVYVDIGDEGDEAFLRSGYSGRERGMRSGDDVTFRWTPGSGNVTSLVLPASPNRDHLLRLRGNAIWPNTIALVVNGRSAGDVQTPAGPVEVEAAIPATAIGASPMIQLELRYARQNVPGKLAPERHRGEARVCNLAINWLQWSTANVPAGTRQQQYRLAEDGLQLAAEWFRDEGQDVYPVAFLPRPHLTARDAKVASQTRLERVARDLTIAAGPSQVLYVNGPLSEIETDAYWLPVVRRWGEIDFDRVAAAERCMAGRLSAGDTEFVVCFNEDITEARDLQLTLPRRDIPLGEAAILRRDGETYQKLPISAGDDGYGATDRLHYYGVYQFAFSPVRLDTPELVLQPGQTGRFAAEVTNLTDRPVRGRVQARATIPTVTGEPQAVALRPGETKTVNLAVAAAPTADWGAKTIYFALEFDGREAVVLRELIVEKPTEVELGNVVVDGARPQIEVRVPDNPYGRTAPLRGARLTLGGQTVELPRIEQGGRGVATFEPFGRPASAKPALEAHNLRIDFGDAGLQEPIEREVFVASVPAHRGEDSDAVVAIAVFNPRSRPLDNELIGVDAIPGAGPVRVQADDGRPVPCQVDPSGRLKFLARVPARSAGTFHVSRAPAQAETDLRMTATDLGSGSGTLRIENSHLDVTLSEAAGGTVTGLRSAKTGRDYGSNAFGISYGTFSRHDPTQPRTDTVQFIHESKTRQQDSPARIEVVCAGPAAVRARVAWRDDRVEVEQEYEFQAYRPCFRLYQRVRPRGLEDEQELVAIDARFQPHRLTKSFPNFVGVPSDREQPHFGWRVGSWVPDYATLMAPHDFDESISMVITRKDGLTGIRQGFWPARRPEPGRCEIAQIELLADRSAGCEAEVSVLLHAGHQVAAKQFLGDWRAAPFAVLVSRPAR